MFGIVKNRFTSIVNYLSIEEKMRVDFISAQHLVMKCGDTVLFKRPLTHANVNTYSKNRYRLYFKINYFSTQNYFKLNIENNACTIVISLSFIICNKI